MAPLLRHKVRNTSREPSSYIGLKERSTSWVHQGAKKALAEIYNPEDKDHALAAATAFAADYGAKWPKATAKITDDLDVLLAFYDYPGEHWLHLRSTDESFKAGVALSAGWDGVSLLGGRGRPRSEEQGRGAGSPAAQLAP
jgi:Transposase, Mutator family